MAEALVAPAAELVTVSVAGAVEALAPAMVVQAASAILVAAHLAHPVFAAVALEAAHTLVAPHLDAACEAGLAAVFMAEPIIMGHPAATLPHLPLHVAPQRKAIIPIIPYHILTIPKEEAL